MKTMRGVAVGALALGLVLTLLGCPGFPTPDHSTRLLRLGDEWNYTVSYESTLPNGTAASFLWNLKQTVVAPPEGATTNAEALAIKSSYTSIGIPLEIPDDYAIFTQDAEDRDLVLIGYSDGDGVFHATERTDLLLMTGRPCIGKTFLYGEDQDNVLQEYEATVSGAAFISSPALEGDCWIVNLSDEQLGYTSDEDLAFAPELGAIVESNRYTSTIVTDGTKSNWLNKTLVSYTLQP